MKINVPHTLSQEEALTRVSKLLTEVKAKYGDKIKDLKEDWNGNKGDFSCAIGPVSASGYLQVQEQEVEVGVDLPIFASMFSGQIKEMVEQELKKLLSA